jgi:hypothetical protein
MCHVMYCVFVGYYLRVCLKAKDLRIKSEFRSQSLKEVNDVTAPTDARHSLDGRSGPYVFMSHKFVQMFRALCLRLVWIDAFYISCDFD